jgi:hypothetical protein
VVGRGILLSVVHEYEEKRGASREKIETYALIVSFGCDSAQFKQSLQEPCPPISLFQHRHGWEH